MSGAITWEQVASIISAGGALLAIVAWVYRGLRAIERRVEEVRAKCANELAEFKLSVAREYATSEAIKEVEERVVEAINRLADRLDRILDHQAKPSRNPT